MARISAFVLFIVLVGCACGQHRERCSSQRVAKCITSHGGFINPPPFPDEKFLDDNCGSLLTMLRCFVEHNKTCVESLEELGGPFRGFAAFESLAAELCDNDSELRRKYLDNVECLTNQQKDITDFLKNFDRAFSELVSKHEAADRLEEDNDLPVIFRCLAFTVISSEIENVVRSSCGQDAADVFNTTYDRLIDFGILGCSQHSERIQHYTDLLHEHRSQNEIFRSLSNVLK